MESCVSLAVVRQGVWSVRFGLQMCAEAANSVRYKGNASRASWREERGKAVTSNQARCGSLWVEGEGE